MKTIFFLHFIKTHFPLSILLVVPKDPKGNGYITQYTGKKWTSNGNELNIIKCISSSCRDIMKDTQSDIWHIRWYKIYKREREILSIRKIRINVEKQQQTEKNKKGEQKIRQCLLLEIDVCRECLCMS